MDSNEAFGLINQLCYRIQFVPDLNDDEVLRRAANDIVNQVSFHQPAQDFYRAMTFSVRERQISQMGIEIARRYNKEEILDFFSRLLHRLDELRPWPRPAAVKLDISLWGSFANAKPIAKINRPRDQISGIFNRAFDEVSLATGKLPVMVLELRSGDIVALVGSIEPRSTTFLLVPRDPGDPTALITRFCECTAFSPQEVIPLSG